MIDNYATTYTHGPEYESIIDGVYSTLKVIENDRKINGNLALTQTMIFNSKIFTRQAKWVSTGLSDLELSWGNWETYASLARMRKIGSTVVALTYNSSTMLKGTVNTTSTIYGKANAAWAQVRVQSQTPYTSVKELIIDGPLDGNSSTFVVYASGAGFVNGHMLSVIAYWTY